MGNDMDDSKETYKSPSEILSNKISGILTDKKFILSSDSSGLEKKLISGKVTAEDWMLMAEKAMDKGESK